MITLSREETGSKPAPGDLALVQAFVNTYDVEEKRDRIGSTESLREWLVAHELLPAGEAVDGADARSVREFREALRDFFAANDGAPLGRSALQTINAMAERSGLAVRFGKEGLALEPRSGGVAGAVARLLAITYAAFVAGTLARLKACRSDTCRWVFYDASKNRSGAWCKMSACGSRSKARAYRRRQAGSRKS